MRSVELSPSSNLSTPSLMDIKRSSGFRTRANAFSRVSEMLSMMPGDGSGLGGWATCWCMCTDFNSISYAFRNILEHTHSVDSKNARISVLRCKVGWREIR